MKAGRLWGMREFFIKVRSTRYKVQSEGRFATVHNVCKVCKVYKV